MNVHQLAQVALLFLLVGCGGISMPQSFDMVGMRFGEGVVNFARVTGRLARDSNMEGMTVESLLLDVVAAPEFTLRFPDGFRVRGKSLTARIAAEHGQSLGKVHDYTEKGTRRLLWLSASEVRILFQFSGDILTGLYIRGPFHCPSVSQNKLVIEWKEGDELIFPLPYAKLRQMLGEPTSVQREPVFSLWACPG